MNVTILYYDDKSDLNKEKIHEIAIEAKRILGEDSEFLALPKSFDLMLDCSVDQLYMAKSIIDTAIQMKLEGEKPISKYLS